MNRLYAYGIALLVALLSIWGWGHSRFRAGQAEAEGRMAVLVAQANQESARKETAAGARVQLLEETHENQVADLDRRYRDALGRVGPVRVQNCPRGGVMPEAPKPAPERDADPIGPGSNPQDGRDFAPALISYAVESERLRIALHACQQYGAEIERFRAQIP
jgi:hypothetical protein